MGDRVSVLVDRLRFGVRISWVRLAWMPAAIVAYIAAVIWPLILFGVVFAAFKILG